jgi:hypothetical protein
MQVTQHVFDDLPSAHFSAAEPGVCTEAALKYAQELKDRGHRVMINDPATGMGWELEDVYPDMFGDWYEISVDAVE